MVVNSVVYIVDDDDDVRAEIQRLLEAENLEVKVYPRAEPFLEAFDVSRPGCVVLDERMPGLAGTAVMEKISKWLKLFPVILVTGFADVTLAVEVMRSGAFDFLEKPFSNKNLLEVVQRALAESQDVWKKNKEDANNYLALQTLTPREILVLDLVLEGDSSRSIGTKLSISPRTVDNHRIHILTKLKAKSLSDLGRAVTRAKMIFGTAVKKSG